MTQTLKRLSMALCLALVASVSLMPVAPVKAEEVTEEETSSIEFWGQLIELSSTDLPTTIVVRENPTGEFTDYTVEIPVGTAFGTFGANTTSMEDWITGDYLHVIGTQNENTGVVSATIIVNSSMNPFNYRGLNGWITAIDETASTMTVDWAGVSHVVNVTENTHMVVPPVNPAALSDFEIGDRVRLRIDKNSDIENDARIIVALRRGPHIFLMARTRGFAATLNDIDDNGDGTGSLTVTLLNNAHLREGDVNNLVGLEGDVETITYDANTKFVRRYNGVTTVDEMVEGDVLFIVGRVNDDETISARLVKDTNIWRAGVARHAGEILSIDTATNTIVVNPIERDGEDDISSLTITYNDDVVIHEGENEISESDLDVGAVIHVRGTASIRDGVLSVNNVESIGIEVDGEEDEEETE